MAVTGTTTTSASSYSYLQYKNKISGLVSGMDIDSIMEKLMKAENAQKEKLQQQQQRYEWKRDAYREVNTTLSAFEKNLFDKYGLSSSWATKTVNNSDTTNQVSVKANGNASGQLTIDSATQATSGKSGVLTSSGLNKVILDENTKLGNIPNLDLTNFKIAGTAMTESSSIKDVIATLSNNGYNASVSKGKLTVTPKANAVAFDTESVESLKKLGLTFNYDEKSDVLKVGTGADEKNATVKTKLSELGIADGSMSIKVAGVDKAINYSTDDTLESLFKKINTETGLSASMKDGEITLTSSENKEFSVETSPINFTSSLKSLTQKNVTYSNPITSSVVGSNSIAELTGADDSESGMFEIRALTATGDYKDTQITYKNTDTIDSIVAKINGSGTGVTAIFNNGQLSISANNTGVRNDGKEAQVSLLSTVKDENGAAIPNNSGALNLFSKLGVTGPEIDGEYTLAKGGKDASAVINGVSYTQKSNTLNITGYSITLNKDVTAPINISSTNDNVAAVDKVKEFVTTYNDLVESLNKQVNEKKNPTYAPLTDAQKSEMTKDEIEKWDKMAKAGIIKSDSTIRNVLAKMRETLFTGVGSDKLYNIGITTSKTWSDGGKLEIDETKLNAALEKDPNILTRIFTGDSATGTEGVVAKMRTAAKDAITSIEKVAGKASSTTDDGFTLGKNIKDIKTKIEDWTTRLKAIEERYWKQFSAMETAINKANSQSSLFTA